MSEICEYWFCHFLRLFVWYLYFFHIRVCINQVIALENLCLVNDLYDHFTAPPWSYLLRIRWGKTNSSSSSSSTGTNSILSNIMRISLDLSSAFDVIDHVILLKRLSHSFGVTGTIYSWIQSYLCGRMQSVRIGRHSYALTPMFCWRSARLCSQTTIIFNLHFTHFYHSPGRVKSLEPHSILTLLWITTPSQYLKSKSCFYHIRSLRHIRLSLDDNMAVSVASAIVSSRLDYVNSILLGCLQKH